MSAPTTESQKRARRRWINFGELVAVAALIISGLGLWNSWQDGKSAPAKVIEQPRAIALVLRGTVESEGRRLSISPVEDSHALDSLTMTFAGGAKIDLGSDGQLSASAFEDALPDNQSRKEAGRIVVQVDARYVEAGEMRRSRQNYALRYRWDSGGLLGGRSVRLTGFNRA